MVSDTYQATHSHIMRMDGGMAEAIRSGQGHAWL